MSIRNSDTTKIKEILNERGNDGWELITINFGKDGMIAFWKRELV